MFVGFESTLWWVIWGNISPRQASYPQIPSAFSLTATIFFLRGSMTRTFLSLQAVQSRLPLRLQLTLKITSGCVSSRLIMASPVPTFQMMIWLSQPKMDTQQTHTHLWVSLYFQSFTSHKAMRQKTIPEVMAQIWSSAVHIVERDWIFSAWRCIRVYQTLQPNVTCTEENIASSWVPRHDADPLRVAL